LSAGEKVENRVITIENGVEKDENENGLNRSKDRFCKK
jgi:hypothetical protein